MYPLQQVRTRLLVPNIRAILIQCLVDYVDVLELIGLVDDVLGPSSLRQSKDECFIETLLVLLIYHLWLNLEKIHDVFLLNVVFIDSVVIQVDCQEIAC